MYSPPPSPTSRLSGKCPQSYVYPVKSLLSGKIFPAADIPPCVDTSSSFDTVADLDLTQREPLASSFHAVRHLATRDFLAG